MLGVPQLPSACGEESDLEPSNSGTPDFRCLEPSIIHARLTSCQLPASLNLHLDQRRSLGPEQWMMEEEGEATRAQVQGRLGKKLGLAASTEPKVHGTDPTGYFEPPP